MNYLEILRELYGVEKVNFELKKMGKDRLYAFLKCDKKDELGIKEYHQGVYFGKLRKRWDKVEHRGLLFASRRD